MEQMKQNNQLKIAMDHELISYNQREMKWSDVVMLEKQDHMKLSEDACALEIVYEGIGDIVCQVVADIVSKDFYPKASVDELLISAEPLKWWL